METTPSVQMTLGSDADDNDFDVGDRDTAFIWIFEINNADVTAGQSVSYASIDKLIFYPQSNEYGDNYTVFTFKVKDDGGTSNEGVDIDLGKHDYPRCVTGQRPTYSKRNR